MHDCTDRSGMAQQNMVSVMVSSPNGRTSQTTRASRSSAPAENRHILGDLQQPPPFTPGNDQNATIPLPRVSFTWRPASTAIFFNNRWDTFVWWRRGRCLHDVDITIPSCLFLTQSQNDTKFRHGTIEDYRSAQVSVLQNEAISRYSPCTESTYEVLFNGRHKKPRAFPKWKVLNVLSAKIDSRK